MIDARQDERAAMIERAEAYVRERQPCLVSVKAETLILLAGFAEEELQRFITTCVAGLRDV